MGSPYVFGFLGNGEDFEGEGKILEGGEESLEGRVMEGRVMRGRRSWSESQSESCYEGGGGKLSRYVWMYLASFVEELAGRGREGKRVKERERKREMG